MENTGEQKSRSINKPWKTDLELNCLCKECFQYFENKVDFVADEGADE